MSVSDQAGIYAYESGYLQRYVRFGEAQGRVLSLSFPESSEDHGTEHDLLDRIERYLTGEEDEFRDVTVALTVPTDRRAVLETVREVPYGEQVACDRLARMTAGLDADAEADLRTVRAALADNPVPLLVPDHRVRDGPSAAPPAVEQRLRAVEGL